MVLRPFSEHAESEGLAFGLSAELLNFISQQTLAQLDLPTLLKHERLLASSLPAAHILPLRRAVWRYERLSRAAARVDDDYLVKGWLDVQGWSWGRQLAPHDKGQAHALARALAGLSAATLKRGRVRLHLKRKDDPRSGQVAHLAEHSEGCTEMLSHRWFQARRAVADGLLVIEVVSPAGEAKRLLPQQASEDIRVELERAVAKPVQDAIQRRAEREVLATASSALLDLLGLAPRQGPVAGVIVDGGRLWTAISQEEEQPLCRDFSTDQEQDLAQWLVGQGVAHVGLARSGKGGAQTGLLRLLAENGLSVEPMRQVGLMKQARSRGGPLKQAAAVVVALRLADPLSGYADLEPDEMGLGEYLDRVDAHMLHAALEDARQAAHWNREHKTGPALASASLTLNPMVRSLADLRPGLELSGVIVNLTNFGAFVEFGLEAQGLIHLSQMAERFVKHPSQVVKVGQQVRVRVLEVDLDRERISLSLRLDRQSARPRSRNKRSDAIMALDQLFKK